MILADKIIENRKRNGWSQEELADMLDVSRQSVSKWESAQSVPDMKKIIQLSQIFGVTTDYLLKDDLDTADFEQTISSDSFNEKVRSVSMEEANAFLQFNEKASLLISVGVMLCILSPVPLLFLNGLAQTSDGRIREEVANVSGVMMLLVMIAGAVALFIMTGLRYQQYDYLENSRIDTLYGVSGFVKECKNAYAEMHSRRLIIGVMLCIISVVPVIMCALFQNDMIAIFGVCILLILCAIGVQLIVHTCIIEEGFEKLLETGDYSRKNKKASRFDGIYWGIVTAVYLGWSFWTMRWGFTWIVWPIGGVLFAVYREIMMAIFKE